MSGPRQLPLSLQHPPSVASEDFLVAAPNRDAFQWLERWPNWPSRTLIIYGPPGCGKTHLTHLFLGRCRGTLVDHNALRLDIAIDVAARSTACIIDDADQAVAAGYEQPLLHLYNVIVERGGHLLLTAQGPPARWSIQLADLRSRLNASPSAGIDPPDDDLIIGILLKLFADRGLTVDKDVALYAVPRIERSFAAARQLVADVDAMALGRRRKITVALLRDVLGASPDSVT